jgi:hypothetical protein
MNGSTNKVCLDKINFGSCTRGDDCPACNDLTKEMDNVKLNQLNFNKNAKEWIPKSKRNENTSENISKDTAVTNDKLSLNLEAQEYKPKMINFNQPPVTNSTALNLQNYQNYYYENENQENAEEMEEEDEGEEFDMIMKDIINNEALEEMEEDDESDEDKWFPKYKDCECCKGFVYKCKGVACENMNACYCKVKDECDEEDA